MGAEPAVGNVELVEGLGAAPGGKVATAEDGLAAGCGCCCHIHL